MVKSSRGLKAQTGVNVDMMKLMQAVANMGDEKEPTVVKKKGKKAATSSSASSAQSMSFLREELNQISSTMTSRLGQLEARVSKMTETLHGVEKTLTDKTKQWDSNFQKLSEGVVSGLGAEREKRLKLMKIVEKYHTQDVALMEKKLSKVKEENVSFAKKLQDDMNSQVVDIKELSEALDEISFNKRHGSPAVDQVGVDHRLTVVESRLTAIESQDMVTSSGVSRYDMQGMSNRASSLHSPARAHIPRTPSRGKEHQYHHTGDHSNGNGQVFDRIVWDLQQQINECRADLSVLKESSRTSPTRGNAESRDIKYLEKKLKKLGDNTSNAYQSLSSGMTDIQQATLHLYAWADKSHGAIGALSTHCGLPKNPCPRVQVYKGNESLNAPRSHAFTGYATSGNDK